MLWLLIISLFWLFCLSVVWLWKSSLLKKTWLEPYFFDTPVLIESDDWGPGGNFHADRLDAIQNVLLQHKDSIGRTAILTADMVLNIPDIQKITQANDGLYFRKSLLSFPEIYQSIRTGIQQGTIVPQLHGQEHLNGKAFALLMYNSDPRISQAQVTADWWNWESLDSPLQGHYVDGSQLPSSPIPETEAQNLIRSATQLFQKLFGHPSFSTVAPCYLWNDEIEQLWCKQGIQVIQTAGYRCTGRDKSGNYIQSPSLIRVGDRNKFGQIYLVRNVMYEPVDGNHTALTAFQEAVIAYKQALPITISTHRYNYTRTEQECKNSLTGLNKLLSDITKKLPDTRFLSSPELGEQLDRPSQSYTNPFNQSNWPGLKVLEGSAKFRAFLYRLYYRHPKLLVASYLTGLIIPAWIFCKASSPKI